MTSRRQIDMDILLRDSAKLAHGSDEPQTPRSRAPADLGPKLRAWRSEQGLSQTQLASLAGLSRKTIQRIELGGTMSGDTVARLSWALDAPVDSMAPEWELPEDPHEPGYGPKIRSRRRALGHSLQTIARQVGVSTATLSRFERGLSLPRGWVFEWTNASGRSRHVIVVEPLAAALRFPSARELHRYCMSVDAAPWQLEADRRSGL